MALRLKPPHIKTVAPPPRAADTKTRPAENQKDSFSSREVAWPGGSGPRSNTRGEGIDTHELLKRQAFESPNDASDNHFEKSRPSPDAVYGEAMSYIEFDSWEQAPSSQPNAGRFDWNMMVQGSTGNQVIGVKELPSTIIQAQIGPFNVPAPAPYAYTLNALAVIGPANQFIVTPPGVGANSALPILTANGAAPSADALTSTLSQIPFGNKVTIELAKQGLQSFSDSKNARHHFEMQATHQIITTSTGTLAAGGTLVLTPLHNMDVFTWTDPIQSIQGVTLTFRNPDYPINFPTSVLTNVAASVDAAAQLLTFTTPKAHGLVAGDRIQIAGYATGNATMDNYVNGTTGLLVGAAGLTSTAFRLNPDVNTDLYGLALGAAIPSSTSITVYIVKNRIRVPMYFRGVIQRLSNYRSL